MYAAHYLQQNTLLIVSTVINKRAFSTKLKHTKIYKSTYRSKAEIVGGSARNSNSGGGSLGTGGSTIVTAGVCCIRGLGCKQWSFNKDVINLHELADRLQR